MTWKHDRRRGHHWATSDWSAFLKKGSLHSNLPCSTFRTEKLKIIHLAVFLSCQSDSFVRQKPKLNIPSEVFRRQKWDTRLQMRAGAGLKMTHYYGNRTKYCGNRGAAGLKNRSSADLYWKHLNRNKSGDIYKVNRNDPGFPQVHFILTIYCNHSNNFSWVDTQRSRRTSTNFLGHLQRQNTHWKTHHMQGLKTYIILCTNWEVFCNHLKINTLKSFKIKVH